MLPAALIACKQQAGNTNGHEAAQQGPDAHIAATNCSHNLLLYTVLSAACAVQCCDIKQTA